MEDLVWGYITKNGLLEDGRSIGAAVSGGADSMALLVCLSALSVQYGFSVSCVHFEHGIRGEKSLADADFVADYCDRLRIPLYMGAADVPALAAEWKLSEETAAKKARESYFASVVESGDVDRIATAHHLDDNAESVLMHILRGSGLNGLCGIQARNGFMVRPLLCVDAQSIYRYIDEKGVPYVVDETNADNRYTRNYVRNVLLPGAEANVNPGVKAALNRLSALAESDLDYMESQADQAYQSCVKGEDGDDVRLSMQAVKALHPAMAARVIRRACARLHVRQDIELPHIQAVMRLVETGKTGKSVNLSHDLRALVEYEDLLICFSRREVDYSFEKRLDMEDRNYLPDGSYIDCAIAAHCTVGQDGRRAACLDVDKLPAELMLRTRHNGDTIRLRTGTKKLKDYFIDRKLPRDVRAKTPLLADGDQVIWIIGHAVSEDYRADGHTQEVLQLEYYGRGEEV